MSEAGTADAEVDVLRSESEDEPVYVAVPAGRGSEVVATHEASARKWRQWSGLLVVVGTLLTAALGLALARHLAGGALGAVVPVLAWAIRSRRSERPTPEVVERGIDRARAEANYDLADVMEWEE